MATGFRLIRQVLGSIVIAAVILGAIGYVIYAVNGILDQVEARDTRERHDTLIVGTATALADRLALIAQGGDSGDAQGAALPTAVPVIAGGIDSASGATDVASATAAASATDAPSPTHEPTATDTATRRPTATDTPTEEPTAVAQAVETATPVPTETPTSTATEIPPTITPIPTNTPRLTATPIPTNTLRPTITPPPTETSTATNTPLPTATYTPSPTPTPTLTYTPTIPPTATYVIEGTYAIPYNTPVVPIPPRVPLMDTDPDVVNFLLLGSDTSGGGVGHTDVMILVSVNKREETVAMWHLPRDLFVYIPNHTMDRLNLAYALGESSGYPGGGFGLMKETILYNLGIEIDHYARVDFDDFMRIVEELGGLEVSVDCAIADWRLISPDLDPTDEDNWEYYTLPIGRQRLTPYMALWYVRSRKTTSDLDRGRRQMDALRAMWYQAREQGLFAQVTQLWPEAVQVVETDMTLTDVLSLVPLAVSLDMSNIARYSGTLGDHYVKFVTPDDKREVMLPDRDRLVPLIENFLTPPTVNRLGRQAVLVDLVDASAYGIGFDRVAADRLAWEGFAARIVSGWNDRPLELSLIYDYTGQTKGSALADLQRVLRVTDSQVVVQPDPNRAVDFRVEIGRAYNSCVYGNAEDEIEAGPPIPTTEPTPGDGTPAANTFG